MQPTLYDYWRSSASYRVRIALNIKGLDYRTIPVDLLKGEHKASEHAARNPQGLVPTMALDGMMMTQSLAIIEYLDETRPEPRLLPPAPADRQRVRALSYAIAMDIHPLTNMTMSRYGASLLNEPDALERWMHSFMTPGLTAFEKLLENRPEGRYCHGDHVTMADLCLVPQIYNARRWKIALEGFSNIAAVSVALEAIPEVAAAHPDRVKQD